MTHLSKRNGERVKLAENQVLGFGTRVFGVRVSGLVLRSQRFDLTCRLNPKPDT
jgi:hypothetical protein